MEQCNSNKKIVVDFYSKVIKEKDSELAEKIIKDDYIQHSPTVETGRAGFMKLLNYLKQLPDPQNESKPFFRFICDGDFVAAHLSIKFMGQQIAVVDLFRLEDEKLAEHWDASEKIPERNDGQRPVVEGPAVIEEPKMTNRNKSIVHSYCKEVLIGRKNQWQKFISQDVIQHNPHLTDGIESLKEYYQSLEIVELHQVVGEGNFVLTQAEGIFNNLPFAIYDIYRLEDDLIVEHWNVKQEIPGELAHSNNMI